jgi:hypothetical protein
MIAIQLENNGQKQKGLIVLCNEFYHFFKTWEQVDIVHSQF